MGKMEAMGFALQEQVLLDTLTIDVLKSSGIEGEILNTDQVRSSIARHLGMDIAGLVPSDRNVDGVAEMMLDAIQNFNSALSKERLFGWHNCLLPSGGMQNFTSVLTNETWRFYYFFNNIDKTLIYNGYNFTFNSKGTVVAVKGIINSSGTWSTFVNSGHDIFLLKFDDDNLEELKKDWKITEYTATNIRLKNESNSSG